MRLPRSRGPLSDRLVRVLGSAPAPSARVLMPPERDPHDDALSLWIIHELHYRGFDGVDDAWEWAPGLAEVRHELERELEERLRRAFDKVEVPTHGDLVAGLSALIDDHDGPSLSGHMARAASYEQTVELLRQRSIYHLKEADPTSWVVPRLEARPKAALLEVLFDEYGAGRADRVHQGLFARGLEAVGLCADYGHYVDGALLPVLEQNNTVSLFGLHRRLRGAALGHFAAFEATSSLPSRRLAQGLERLGMPGAMVAYYDEHVEADAVHEQLALRHVCGALVEEQPELREDVLFGAWACLELEARTSAALLESWDVA